MKNETAGRAVAFAFVSRLARAAIVALAFLLASFLTGCGPSFVAVRPTEPLVADAGHVHAEVGRVFLTDEVRRRGLADDVDLVVELSLKNGTSVARRVSPGSFSCLLALDARRPAETRALLPGGGGEGAFPGQPPDEGSLLAAITVPPGETRAAWALFHGYRFDGSEIPRRVTLTIPVEGAPPVDLELADPARGALRWETPPEPSTWSIGVDTGSTLASGLRASLATTEITRVQRSGRVLWDLGLASTLMVETQGPLVSETSAFSGTGFTGHLSLPLLSWGAAQDPSQLGVFGGATAELLAEVPKPRAADDMRKLHVYGLLQAQAGLELTFGRAPLASTPFPLTPSAPALPRWGFRLGYQQTWVGGVTSGGFMTSLRFLF